MRSSVPLRVVVACALFSLVSQRARAEPIALPKEIHVSVERCVGLVFDVEAYAQALRVELVALGIREPLAPAGQPADPWQDVSGSSGDGAQSQSAQGRSPRYVELVVTAPGCRDELSVTLRLQRPGESRQSVETLRPSDFEGLGRERALALATVERLRVSWARLIDPPAVLAPKPGVIPSLIEPSTSAPGSPGARGTGDPAQATPQDATPAIPDAKAEAEKTAADKKKDVKPEAPAKQGEKEQGEREDDELVAEVVPTSGGFLGGGFGYLGALGWQLRGGVFFDRGGRWRVDPQIDVHASRDYSGGAGQAGTSSDAYRVMLGAIVQAQLYGDPDFELSLGPGLRFGVAWVDYNVPDAATPILVPNGDGVLVPVEEFVDIAGVPVDSASSAEPSTPVAPLALTTLTLTVRATIAEPVAVLLWIEGGYAVLGAEFYARSEPVVALSGASLSLGFAAAYLF